MAEDGADLVADLLIAGNKSEIIQRTKELEANGEKNAAGKAALEWVKQTALDGLGGLISGGFFGAASGIAGGINPQINFNENENVNTEVQQNVDNTAENVVNTEAERKSRFLDLTNADVENIIKDEASRQKFTDATGILLNGTNAENRAKVKQYSAYQQFLENESNIDYAPENTDNANEMLQSLLYERNGLDPEIQNALDYRTDEQIAEERGIDDAEWLEYGLNDISNSNNNTIPQLSLYGVPGREYGLGTESQLGNGVRVNRLQNDTKSDIYYNGNEIPTVNGKSEAKELAKFSEARKKSKARASVMAEDTGLNPRTNDESSVNNVPAVTGLDNGSLGYYTQAKGEFENDRKISMGYDGTGSKGVLRGSNDSNEMDSGGDKYLSDRGLYLPTDSVSVANDIKQGESIYTESERKDIQSRGLYTPAFYNASNNPVIFSQALETAKASNKYGAAVDSHTPEQMQEIISKGGMAFLVEDGTAGGAVKRMEILQPFSKTPKTEHRIWERALRLRL